MPPWLLGLRKTLRNTKTRQAGPAAFCPPEAWTLGLSQGDRGWGQNPWSSLPQEKAGTVLPGKMGGVAAGAGSSYQDAILGNRGVRTSWVKANQAMAMRLPATPP